MDINNMTKLEKLKHYIDPDNAGEIAGVDKISFEILNGNRIRFDDLSELAALRLFHYYTMNGHVATLIPFYEVYNVYVSLKE